VKINNQFKSDFIVWAREMGLPEHKIQKLKNTLNDLFLKELTARDDQKNIVIRHLSNSGDLNLEYENKECQIFKISEEKLVVGVITPNWKIGWRNIDDEDIRDLIQFYLHFAEQYIARSRALSIIGGIALTYDRACDFRFGTLNRLRLDYFKTEERKKHLPEKVKIDELSPQIEVFKKWVEKINGLDPYIHRAIFNFWKSIRLLEISLYEESTTALNSTISVAAEYCQNRFNATSDNRFIKLEEIGLKSSYVPYLEDLEQLRNEFGAHPTDNKWWDFAEMYGDVLDHIVEIIKEILDLLCKHEATNRTINRSPENWSEWLNKNNKIVFDAVWYHKQPDLYGAY